MLKYVSNMDVLNYLASNIPVFSMALVLYYLAIRNYPFRKKESIYFIIFTSIVLFLTFVVEMERYAPSVGNVILATIFASIGYILRPLLIYVFVLIANSNHENGKRFMTIFTIPLFINLVIYLFPLFFGVPGLSTFVFYYQANGDGTATFIRGSFMNFFSHFVCAIYLGVLVYVSTIRFHGIHRRDGVVVLLCVIFIFVTVLVEILMDRNDLLNIACLICEFVNYIFIMTVNSSRDPLTQLYDRRTYNEDTFRFHERVNGIIQIDMNELKYINDNFGHSAGDAALKFIASVLEKSCVDASMCAYRLSGDEFTILMFNGKKERLEETASRIKENMKESQYAIALGCYFIPKDEKISFEDANAKAEDLMYQDKANYYKDSKRDRRR